jgi:hypothetical protein
MRLVPSPPPTVVGASAMPSSLTPRVQPALLHQDRIVTREVTPASDHTISQGCLISSGLSITTATPKRAALGLSLALTPKDRLQ